MTAPFRWILSTSLALVLGALLLLTAGPGWAPQAEAAVGAPSAAHPYSDPTWFPIHTPVRIGCAKSACGSSADHGYWAIDFHGDQGDPIYAAGAGIAHIGGDSGDCSGTGEVGGGRWVWIDHGAGVVSRYHHLDSITIKEGQLVTPATQIGTMGHSGDVPPCAVNYLHFEVRHGGLYGDRIDFGQLKACKSGRTVNLPADFGFDSWDAPGLHPAKKLWTEAYDSRCLSADWMDSASSPAASATRGDGSVKVAIDAPATIRSWIAHIEIWRPSLNEWKTLEYRSVDADTTSTVFTDQVENNRRYRVQTAVYQGSAWSAWSATREVVGTPAAPGVRYLGWARVTNMKKSYLHFGWSRPNTMGSDVTGYTVSRRCGATLDELGAWKTKSYSASTYYKNLNKLKKAKACEVKIAATNAAGTGTWSDAQQVTR